MQRLQRIAWIIARPFLLVFLCYVLFIGGGIAYALILTAVAGVLIAYPKLVGRLPVRITTIVDSRDRWLDWLPVAAVVSLAVLLRLAWGFYVRVEPGSDFRVFYNEAQGLSDGYWRMLGTSKSPVSVLWYGLLSVFPGNASSWIYAGNALLGGLQCYLVYRIAARLYRSRTAARLGALVIAVFPSLVMYSALPSSEMPFVTLLLLLLFISIHRYGQSIAIAAAFGITASLMHLSRNIGVLYAIVLLAALWIFASVTWRRKIITTVVAVMCGFVVLIPQIVYNYRTYRIVSINSARTASHSLLFGTNFKTEGGHSHEDLRYLARKKNVGREARRLALYRIRQDPAGFARLALGPKIRRMWCDDGYAMQFAAIGQTPPRVAASGRHETWRRFLLFAGEWSAAFYVAFLLLCIISLASYPGRSQAYRFYTVMAGSLVGITFLLHLFIEVQGRYHFFLPFVLAILAGGLLDRESARDHSVT